MVTAVTGSVYIYQEMLIEMFYPMVSVYVHGKKETWG